MTTKPYTGIKVAPGRAEALAALHREVCRALDEGRHVPCCGIDADVWLSEQRADQEAAAEACQHCPVLSACHSYVSRWPEPGGTWAGRAPLRGRPSADTEGDNL